MIAGADGFLLVFGAFTGILADAVAQRIIDGTQYLLPWLRTDLDDIRFEAHAPAR